MECSKPGGAHEGQQQPGDDDAFRGIAFDASRRPQGEADQPVAQHRAGQQLDRARIDLVRDIAVQIVGRTEDRAAATRREQAREDQGAGEIAEPDDHDQAERVAAADGAAREAEAEIHDVAGEQLRPGKDREDEPDAEHHAGDQRPRAGREPRRNAQRQDDGDADIAAGEHGAHERAARRSVKGFGLVAGNLGEMDYRGLVHRLELLGSESALGGALNDGPRVGGGFARIELYEGRWRPAAPARPHRSAGGKIGTIMFMCMSARAGHARPAPSPGHPP